VVNLVAGEGHPAAVMDVSFTVGALSAVWLTSARPPLPPGVHEVPGEIDAQAAGLMLACMGTEIDELTLGQQEYLDSWRYGS
jgi:adenosylhomocysteinase